MTLALENGVSVLICTYNGGGILPETLEYLGKQKFKNKIPWEVIIVNNGSTDNTASTLEATVAGLRKTVSVHLFFEPKRGKENAVDLGLRISTYKYVLICDDDNWLSDNYIETAFNLMESNPSIGLLGGKGIAAIEGTIPHWFDFFKSYYAVGEQYHFNGEIKHFWPRYQFIWGAGSVINKSAYKLLLDSGFQRILTYELTGKISRSEDLELCFAIWLTGFKLWYDNNLIYHHHITQDRLADKSLLKIIKISMPASYYLRPYNIIKFTGTALCLKRRFWYKNVVTNFNALIEKNNWRAELKFALRFITGRITVSPFHIYKLIQVTEFYASLKLGYGYEMNFKKVFQLKKNIDLLLSKQKEM